MTPRLATRFASGQPKDNIDDLTGIRSSAVAHFEKIFCTSDYPLSRPSDPEPF
jgi:hypothetical protein